MNLLVCNFAYIPKGMYWFFTWLKVAKKISIQFYLFLWNLFTPHLVFLFFRTLLVLGNQYCKIAQYLHMHDIIITGFNFFPFLWKYYRIHYSCWLQVETKTFFILSISLSLDMVLFFFYHFERIMRLLVLGNQYCRIYHELHINDFSITGFIIYLSFLFKILAKYFNTTMNFHGFLRKLPLNLKFSKIPWTISQIPR